MLEEIILDFTPANFSCLIRKTKIKTQLFIMASSMNKISTPDLCDQYEGNKSIDLRILDSIFHSYGGRTQFYGQVVTIKCFEDNSIVKQLVGTPGAGRVIVMDGGGSLRRAVLGDMLGAKAVENGWSGLIINGCVRDADELHAIDLGVKALNTHPMKTDKRGLGDRDVEVSFAGQIIRPDDWIYADNNGIIVANSELDLL